MSKKQTEQPENQENITDETTENQGAEVNEETENTNPADIVSKFEALVKELNEKYLRLYAEFDNFRRRTQKEKADLIKYGGEEIILSILPIVDDMERALSHHKEGHDHKPLKEGLDLILQKTKNILTSKGVQAMEPKGEAFDPELHDAITNIPATSEEQKGKVAEVVEKGYSLNGKVIRHAKVVVAN
ncbi:MAG TPA: nucleotide exchange factor GrpE [Bacteroidia bacterium]|nr:nucleotide exchange factor GrpE [Bacteroidia bacterium]